MKLFFVAFAMALLQSFSPQTVLSQTEFCQGGGREFRFAIAPNAHVQEGILRDSTVLYITAAAPTIGEIIYRDRGNVERRVQFSIADSNGSFRHAIWWGAAELVGVNYGVQPFPEPSAETERISRRSFAVTALQPVAVYVLSQGEFTADAISLLPKERCGTDYIVTTLPEEFDTPNNPERLYPAQCVITAYEDSTRVVITPSAPTWRNRTARQQVITLQKGETYLVQTAGSTPQPASLSGTVISANKSIAVIAGNQRSLLPSNSIFRSRDHISTQITPIAQWGSRYIVFPFPQPADYVAGGSDIALLTASETAQVRIGSSVQTIAAGQTVEIPVQAATGITSDKPLAVYVVKRSSVLNTDPTLLFRRGDPFIMQVLSKEYTATEYNVPVVQANSSGGGVSFPERYAMIVIDSNAIAGLRMNGVQPIVQGRSAVPDTSAIVATIALHDTVKHLNLKAQQPFAAYIIGYGAASGFGYQAVRACTPADTVLPDPDASAPTVRVLDSCSVATITAFENRPNDSGIDTLIVIASENIRLSVEAYRKADPILRARAELINPLRDGTIEFEVRDVQGNSSRITIQLGGFTLAFVPLTDSITPPQLNIITEQGRDTCFNVEIVNYGATRQTLSRVTFKTNLLRSQGISLPITLNPGERRTFQICVKADSARTFNDTMLIADACGERIGQFINAVIQPPPPVQTGREFYLAFPPNFHNIWTPVQDTCYVYIATNKATQGSLRYVNDVGAERQINFTIPDSTVFTIPLPYNEVELVGVNFNFQVPFLNNTNEVISKRSLYIETDNDVTVYALNQAVYTSEAFSVLPVNALGKKHMIASYKSDAYITGGGNATTSSTPSQFVIIASADSTQITIKPSAPTFRFGLQEQQITLNKGELYLVQARMQAGVDTTIDLTGTLIESSKPVAVISGHQRALVPWDRVLLSSRDCLIEQMPPVESWGNRALIVPFASPSQNPNRTEDFYRVIAAYDSTAVVVDNNVVATLNAGEFVERPIGRAHEVRTSQPALFVSYKHTSGLKSEETLTPFRPGDPFIMVVPSSAKFFDEYRFVSCQSYEAGSNQRVFTEQRATIVIPREKASSLRIDNVPIAPAAFQDVVGTPYVYAFINLADGVHVAKADTTFGLYVYGYGIANSYGYVGGGLFSGTEVSVSDSQTGTISNVKAYPQPVIAGNTLTLTIPARYAIENIILRDALGRTLPTTYRVAAHTANIETSALTPGVYSAEIRSGAISFTIMVVVTAQ